MAQKFWEYKGKRGEFNNLNKIPLWGIRSRVGYCIKDVKGVDFGKYVGKIYGGSQEC